MIVIRREVIRGEAERPAGRHDIPLHVEIGRRDRELAPRADLQIAFCRNEHLAVRIVDGNGTEPELRKEVWR